MRLFYGGFGDYMAFAVAEDTQGAIEKIGEKIKAPWLPVTAEEIVEVDGFEIRPVIHGDSPEAVISATVDPAEPEKPSDLRHCKKCDFACETQGQLLAHYREMHPKGD